MASDQNDFRRWDGQVSAGESAPELDAEEEASQEASQQLTQRARAEQRGLAAERKAPRDGEARQD